MPEVNLLPTAPYSLRWINIEFASACNLRCKWCSLDHDKPKQLMQPELLEQVLSEIAEDDAFQLDRIELHNGGEVLMHPRLSEMLAVIRRRKDQLPPIHLLTNAGLLTEARAHTILDSGAVSKVRFSVDGGSAQAFEEVRAPAKWPKIRDNITRFLDLNQASAHPLETDIICLVDPSKPLESDWMEPEFQQLFARVDQINLRWPHNWDGSEELGIDDVSYKLHAQDREHQTCYFLQLDMVVLPNGDVTVCCADLNSRGVIANLRGSSLREAYLSQARRTMLEKFAAGRKDDIDLCSGCTGYYL